MITFDGQALFTDGPARVTPGPLASRDAVADAPGAIGASLVSQGVSPRSLTQHGTLLADTAADLQAVIDAIQQRVGTSATLIDQHSKAWPECVMRSVSTQPIQRLGPRYAAAYDITYLQTHP